MDTLRLSRAFFSLGLFSWRRYSSNRTITVTTLIEQGSLGSLLYDQATDAVTPFYKYLGLKYKT